MLRKIILALTVVGAVGVPAALADDCFDRCYQNCMKFGNGDMMCTWMCSDQTCRASTLNGVEIPQL